jgi:hypothetical protein
VADADEVEAVLGQYGTDGVEVGGDGTFSLLK